MLKTEFSHDDKSCYQGLFFDNLDNGSSMVTRKQEVQVKSHGRGVHPSIWSHDVNFSLFSRTSDFDTNLPQVDSTPVDNPLDLNMYEQLTNKISSDDPFVEDMTAPMISCGEPFISNEVLNIGERSEDIFVTSQTSTFDSDVFCSSYNSSGCQFGSSLSLTIRPQIIESASNDFLLATSVSKSQPKNLENDQVSAVVSDKTAKKNIVSNQGVSSHFYEPCAKTFKPFKKFEKKINRSIKRQKVSRLFALKKN